MCVASLSTAARVGMALFLGLLAMRNVRAQKQTRFHTGQKSERLKADGSNLFRVLEANFDKVAFQGQRTYAQRGRNNKITRYDEEISIQPKRQVDPNDPMQRRASFRLKLTGVPTTTPRPSLTQLTLMIAEFMTRSGFIHYQRDFRVYDSRRAAQNYSVVPMGILVRSSRALRIFDVHPKSPALSSYRILVDMEHQVVLGQLELSPDRRLNNALAYRSVKFGAKALASMAKIKDWWQASIPINAHKTVAAANAAAGFEVKLPPKNSLPRGFVLHSIRTASDPYKIQKSKYIVLIYSDGIETFYLIQVLSSDSSKAFATVGNKIIVKVFHYESGPAEQYFAEYKGRGYLLIGNFANSGLKGRGIPAFYAGLLR